MWGEVISLSEYFGGSRGGLVKHPKVKCKYCYLLKKELCSENVLELTYKIVISF